VVEINQIETHAPVACARDCDVPPPSRKDRSAGSNADEWYERQRRLMAVVDHLNGKYGRDTVRCGIFPTAGAWRTRFAKRSPI